MRQQAISSRLLYGRPIPVGRLVNQIAEKAQLATQQYGRRPYGVGFLVIGKDERGPHLHEFSPDGNSFEYTAMSIGARSQMAKTYLERHFESFADSDIETLINHGLQSLKASLQQSKTLTPLNTSIAIVGPPGPNERGVGPQGSFRILEGDDIRPFIDALGQEEPQSQQSQQQTDQQQRGDSTMQE